jgi:hypothetical protein
VAVYGVDSIPAWLRLQAVVPKDVQASINDAKARVDMFVNFIVVSLVIMLLTLCRMIWTHTTLAGRVLAGHSTVVEWDSVELALLLLSACGIWTCYRGAVNHTKAWGEVVKSAFDLYLPALAKQMGYGLPDTAQLRRDFWDAVNRMFLYAEPIDPAHWPREPASQASRSAPSQDDD